MKPALTSDERAALRALAGGRVAVVGDVMLDEFVYGDSTRLSPEAPVPVVNVQEEMDCLGGAANVAKNIHDLGAEPLLIGVVGRDETAERVRRTLTAAGLDASRLITDPARKTGIKTRVIARGQQLVRIDHESTDPIDAVTAGALSTALANIAGECTAVIFSDYGKGVLGPKLLPGLRELLPGHVFSCVDPFPNHMQAYRGFGAITPNHDEARRMYVAEDAHRADGPTLAAGLHQQVGVREVYVTLGRAGIAYCGDGEEVALFPTRQRQVFDVSGAGDTVIAMIAALRGLGVSPETTCRLSNRAAGLVVEKIGTATVTQAEILQDAEDPDDEAQTA